MGDLQLHRTQTNPMGTLGTLFSRGLRAVAESAMLFRIRPLPSDVQFLKIYICTLPTQSISHRVYTKQRGLPALAWNLDQIVLALLHQIESLPTYVCQMRITNSGHGSD